MSVPAPTGVPAPALSGIASVALPASLLSANRKRVGRSFAKDGEGDAGSVVPGSAQLAGPQALQSAVLSAAATARAAHVQTLPASLAPATPSAGNRRPLTGGGSVGPGAGAGVGARPSPHTGPSQEFGPQRQPPSVAVVASMPPEQLALRIATQQDDEDVAAPSGRDVEWQALEKAHARAVPGDRRVTDLIRYLSAASNLMGTPTAITNMSSGVRYMGDVALYEHAAPAWPPGEPLPSEPVPYPTTPPGLPCLHCTQIIDRTIAWHKLVPRERMTDCKDHIRPIPPEWDLDERACCEECLIALSTWSGDVAGTSLARVSVARLGGNMEARATPPRHELTTFGGSIPPPVPSSPVVDPVLARMWRQDRPSPPGHQPAPQPRFLMRYTACRAYNPAAYDPGARAAQLAAMLTGSVPPHRRCLHCALDATLGGSVEPVTGEEPGWGFSGRFCSTFCAASYKMSNRVGLIRETTYTGGVVGPAPPVHMLATMGGPVPNTWSHPEQRLLYAREPVDMIVAVFAHWRFVPVAVERRFKGIETSITSRDTFAETSLRGAKLEAKVQDPVQRAAVSGGPRTPWRIVSTLPAMEAYMQQCTGNQGASGPATTTVATPSSDAVSRDLDMAAPTSASDVSVPPQQGALRVSVPAALVPRSPAVSVASPPVAAVRTTVETTPRRRLAFDGQNE